MPPIIDPKYLSAPADVEMAIQALRRPREGWKFSQMPASRLATKRCPTLMSPHMRTFELHRVEPHRDLSRRGNVPNGQKKRLHGSGGQRRVGVCDPAVASR